MHINFCSPFSRDAIELSLLLQSLLIHGPTALDILLFLFIKLDRVSSQELFYRIRLCNLFFLEERP